MFYKYIWVYFGAKIFWNSWIIFFIVSVLHKYFEYLFYPWAFSEFSVSLLHWPQKSTRLDCYCCINCPNPHFPQLLYVSVLHRFSDEFIFFCVPYLLCFEWFLGLHLGKVSSVWSSFEYQHQVIIKSVNGCIYFSVYYPYYEVQVFSNEL